MSQLSDEQIDNLVRFLGYGDVSGKYWFIGIEEAGDSDQDANIRQHVIRSQFPAIQDLAAAHSADKLNWEMTKLIPTWSTMSRIVMHLDGRGDWEETESAREYQSTRLGRLTSETLLLDLLPLRKISDSTWPDWEPFSRWTTWQVYFDEMCQLRIPLLADLWRKHRPSYTICYGKWYWPHYQKIFNLTFQGILNGKAQVARSGDCVVALTPFFSTRAGVTKAFIDELARELEVVRT